MILHDTTVSLLRCANCLAAFVATINDKSNRRPNMFDILVDSPCRVCGKTELDYLGEVPVSEPPDAPER